MHTGWGEWGRGFRMYQRSSCIDATQPRGSLSYDKLPPKPLHLTVIKLDGSSFGVKVAKTGSVAKLKLAVEAAFDHLPKKGPAKVSRSYGYKGRQQNGEKDDINGGQNVEDKHVDIMWS